MTALAPKMILGPVMRSFDMQLGPRQGATSSWQVDESYLNLSSNYFAQSKHQLTLVLMAENASRKESYRCRYLP